MPAPRNPLHRTPLLYASKACVGVMFPLGNLHFTRETARPYLLCIMEPSETMAPWGRAVARRATGGQPSSTRWAKVQSWVCLTRDSGGWALGWDSEWGCASPLHL